MGKLRAIADIAGVASNIVGTIAGHKTKRMLAKSGDKIQTEANASKEHMAMLNFRSQNSYNAVNRTKFDSLVDGLNRLVFPLTAFPFIVMLWVLVFTDMSGLMKAIGTAGLLSIIGTLLGVRQFGKYQVRKTEEKKIDVAKEIQKDIIKNNPTPDDFVNIETESNIKKVQEFVEKFGPMSEEVEKKYNLPAHGVLAHAALETGWGKHILSGYDPKSKKQKKINTNNIFNIKKSKNWKGKVITKKAWEIKKGKKVDEKSLFKVYKNAQESFNDYAELLTLNKRYEKVIGTKTAKEYGQALYDAGYMTDLDAPEKIEKIANKYFIYET